MRFLHDLRDFLRGGGVLRAELADYEDGQDSDSPTQQLLHANHSPWGVDDKLPLPPWQTESPGYGLWHPPALFKRAVGSRTPGADIRATFPARAGCTG